MLETVSVVTNDGRTLLGQLTGFDQTLNIILKDTQERIFSMDGVETVSLGVYIIRGDNIAIVGLVDKTLDAGIVWTDVKAEQLPQISFHV